MKKLLLLAIALTPFLLFAQEEKPDYVMYETMYVKPDYSNLGEFQKAMKHHNDTYHSDAPYTALVWNVTTGPKVGYLVWMMGPCTYSDIDDRPSGEHDKDWAMNVMPHIKHMTHGEYWKRDSELSNVIEGRNDPLVRVRFVDINFDQDHRVDEFLGRISKAVKAMEGDNPWAVYHNDHIQGDRIGRHIALVTPFENWAALDNDDNFMETFEEVHGEGSWQVFLEDWNQIFEDTYDEFWSLNSDMSALPDED